MTMNEDEELPKYTRRAPAEPLRYTPYAQHAEGSYESDVITQETSVPHLPPAPRAHFQHIHFAPYPEPKEDEILSSKKEDTYEQPHTEPGRLYNQTNHKDRRRSKRGWRRCLTKRYLCVIVTVLALVITGVVLFVHYRNKGHSKANRSATPHPSVPVLLNSCISRRQSCSKIPLDLYDSQLLL